MLTFWTPGTTCEVVAGPENKRLENAAGDETKEHRHRRAKGHSLKADGSPGTVARPERHDLRSSVGLCFVEGAPEGTRGDDLRSGSAHIGYKLGV